MKRKFQYLSIIIILFLIASLSIYLFSSDRFSNKKNGYELLQIQLKKKKDTVSTDIIVKNNYPSQIENNSKAKEEISTINTIQQTKEKTSSNSEKNKDTSEDFILEVSK